MPPARLALYVSTAAVIAMAGFAVLVAPPPLVVSAVALAGYVGLLFGGVFVLRWRVFVDAVLRGPKGARGVVLTFDDGPHPEWTPRILRLLAEQRATATFFVVGRKAEKYPEIVQAIVRAGHGLGIHSHEHDRFFGFWRERQVVFDLERAMVTLEKITGRRPILFRPPIGITNPIIARAADHLGLRVVGWTIRGLDGVAWARPQAVAARVRRDLSDGAIVLLHDAPEHGDRQPASLGALPAIFDSIASAGLDIVALSDWLHPGQPLGKTT